MATDPSSLSTEALLAQSGWLHALARQLVGDGSAADDLVQDTLVAALRRPPDAERPLRPWLAKVARNLVRARVRSEASRKQREASRDPQHEMPSAAELSEKLESQHLLVAAIRELSEPYRSTILLHYWEHLSSEEIARRLGIPSGTVRWRLKQGVDALRQRLDARSGGDRRAWIALLIPLTRENCAPAASIAIGAVGMNVLWKASAAATLTAALAAGWWVATTPENASTADSAPHEAVEVDSPESTLPAVELAESRRPDRESIGDEGRESEWSASASPMIPELPFVDVSAGLPQSGTWIGYPLLHDFNGDGLADLVASNREEDGFSAWEAVEGGGWRLRIEGLERDMGYGPARAADVDSDGIPDLLVSAHTDALRVYLNDGQMNWTRSVSPIQNEYLLLDIAAGELDADGLADILGVGHFKGGLSVFAGDGKGGFFRRPESGALIHEQTFGRVVTLADLDGDGRDDLFATTNEGAKVFLTRGEGTLQWEDISSNLPNPKIGNSLQALAVARMTGKPQPELAICMVADPGDQPGARNSIGVYAWRSAEKRWEQIDEGLDRRDDYRDLKIADMDLDGKLDLVAMTRANGVVIYTGDGTGKFELQGRLTGSRTRGRIALGDIDGDGRTDIAITASPSKNSPDGGGVFAFLNRPWH